MPYIVLFAMSVQGGFKPSVLCGVTPTVPKEGEKLKIKALPAAVHFLCPDMKLLDSASEEPSSEGFVFAIATTSEGMILVETDVGEKFGLIPTE